jgi:hypothetical protein
MTRRRVVIAVVAIAFFSLFLRLTEITDLAGNLRDPAGVRVALFFSAWLGAFVNLLVIVGFWFLIGLLIWRVTRAIWRTATRSRLHAAS